jgi:CubicO group peptidase (beta-lactamase class C family)
MRPAAIDEDMPLATEPHVVTAPPRTIEELKTRLRAVLEREHIAGASIALVDRNGPIWIGGLGVRDRATGAPVGADTAFRVGSLTKSVIALGVMRLVDQGKLDVDRPLREIIPDVAIDNPWEAVAPVTLAHCLEHTAGFDDVRFNEIFATDEGISVRDALSINPRSRKVRWRPGTRHAYSNVGYTVAARAIEVASGEPFDVYLKREILAPLGIVDADFRRTPSLIERLATGYMEGERAVVYRSFAHRPAGALLASATDIAKLVHFWIVRGEGYPPIVSRAGLARIERGGTLPYPRVDAEYGFANYTDPMHPALSHGHDGGMPGFHASFRYFSDLGIGYAVLLNSNYSFRGYFDLRSLLFAYMTQGKTFTPPPPAPATAPPGARFFTAEAPQNTAFGFMDRIWNGWSVSPLDRDALRVTHLSGFTAKLIPTKDGGYRMPFQSGSSVRFTTNADGTPIMVHGFSYAEAGSESVAYLRLAALKLVMVLLWFVPLWAAFEFLLGAFVFRRALPRSLVLWPALAGLCCRAIPRLLDKAFFDGIIGTANPVTIGLCAATIGYAIASAATLVSSIRWLRRDDRPRLLAMLVPLTCGLAFTAFAIFLGANGIIGLRTWAW